MFHKVAGGSCGHLKTMPTMLLEAIIRLRILRLHHRQDSRTSLRAVCVATMERLTFERPLMHSPPEPRFRNSTHPPSDLAH